MENGLPRVLVVDDDPATRLIVRRALTREKRADVEEAASGEEAIERLESQRYDCVLSDYRMGGTSGIEVLAFAKGNNPATRRVLMSGFADPALVERARAEADIHEFVEKPMGVNEFAMDIIRAVLGD